MQDASASPLPPKDIIDRIITFVESILNASDNTIQPYTLPQLFELLQAYLSKQPSQGNAETQTPEWEGKSFSHTLKMLLNVALEEPEQLAQRYADFAHQVLAVLRQQSQIEPEPNDKRFRDPLWHESPILKALMQIYLAWGKALQQWLDEQQLDEHDRRRAQFILDQAKAAFTPSNLPLNPAALKRADRTAGSSAVSGLLNWVNDMTFNQGLPRQINPHAYTLGCDLAQTKGSVVYRDKCLELIQYAPQTSHVHRRPVLLIPPQINKYYIFDLKEKNSMLGYLVKQGMQMFVVSWKNPDARQGHWNLDVYIASLIRAIEAIQSICKSKKVSLISACAGGLTAQSLLGYLAMIKRPIIQSHSLLVTALTPNNGSILELFTTQKSMQDAKFFSRQSGVLDGRVLAKVFAWLRPNDLIWNYWVNNYLLGNEPPPLDVLYWDNDSTRLPWALHSDFIDIFSEEVFTNPNKQVVLGQSIDYRRLHVNMYLVAGKDDYLMPWKGVYKSTQVFSGKHRFVLSTSGHVQSILRPPSLARTHFYANDELSTAAQQWYDNAILKEGSWWHDWMIWLKQQSGALKHSPKNQGNQDHPALEPAPGRYVKERCDE